MNLNCQSCGAALFNGEAICPYCGNAIEPTAAPFYPPGGDAPEYDDPQNFHRSLSFQDSDSQINYNSGAAKFFAFLFGFIGPLFITPILFFIFNRGKSKPCAKFLIIGVLAQICLLLLFLGALYLSGEIQ